VSPDDLAALKAGTTQTQEPTLRLAIADYDRTRPLINGSVKPQGFSLKTASPHIAVFCNRPPYEEYDITEMSFSMYVAAKGRGEPVIALPIFPLRMAVLAYIFVRTDSPYQSPSDLVGKRIASIGYRYTVNLWLRGMFKEHYGLAPEQVTWVTSDEKEGAGYVIPKTVKVEPKPGRSPGELLLAGEVDAVLGPEAPDEFHAGHPGIRRLFVDAKAECANFFRKTGIFPFTHVVAMSTASWRARPWVAEPLIAAFTEAQRQCDAFYYANAKHVTFPDTVFFLEEQRRVWGPNPWPHGMAANRHTAETFVRYAHEQGYIDRRLSIEELFAENTLHT
jgi:4,5-dihydroxyphthalate decarboxylase